MPLSAPRRWRQAVALVMLAGGVAACAPRAHSPLALPAPETVAAAPATPDTDGKCRVGAGGAPVGPIQSADRGIGGTGAPQLADRGIGGTGIIGVITGFASVCVNGVEVGLSADAAVVADGQNAAATDLRAGQLAVIDAGGDPAAFAARRVTIRHEVSGPVEKVDLAPGTDRRVLQVAGQQVLVPDWVWGDRAVKVGEWIEVSGLRRFDGSIDATRIDLRLRGRILVHGKLTALGNGFGVGNLALRADFDLRRYVGQAVTVTGLYVPPEGSAVSGALRLETIAPDLLAIDPVAYFGAGVGTFIFEDYVEVVGGRVRLARGSLVGGGGRFDGQEPGRAVLTFQRHGGGDLSATSLQRSNRSTTGWIPDSLNGRPLGDARTPFGSTRSGLPGSPADRGGRGPGRGAGDRSGGRALPPETGAPAGGADPFGGNTPGPFGPGSTGAPFPGGGDMGGRSRGR